jgi:hypothetical protein
VGHTGHVGAESALKLRRDELIAVRLAGGQLPRVHAYLPGEYSAGLSPRRGQPPAQPMACAFRVRRTLQTTAELVTADLCECELAEPAAASSRARSTPAIARWVYVGISHTQIEARCSTTSTSSRVCHVGAGEPSGKVALLDA